MHRWLLVVGWRTRPAFPAPSTLSTPSSPSTPTLTPLTTRLLPDIFRLSRIPRDHDIGGDPYGHNPNQDRNQPDRRGVDHSSGFPARCGRLLLPGVEQTLGGSGAATATADLEHAGTSVGAERAAARADSDHPTRARSRGLGTRLRKPTFTYWPHGFV